MGDKLLWVVRNGDMESLKKIEFDPNMEVNKIPILVSAADYGQFEVIEYLLKKGACVDKASTTNITPILAAIWEDHVEAVKVLLKHGAKKNGTAPDGSTYIEAASSAEMKALLK